MVATSLPMTAPVAEADIVIDDTAVAKEAEVIVDDSPLVDNQKKQVEAFIKDGKDLISSIKYGLEEGVEAPPEMQALEDAIDDSTSTPSLLSRRIYELTIEKGMCYDVHPDTGRMVQTKFDIQANLDHPNVKSEFFKLYSYGMQASMTGLLEVETVKDIVQERLVKRTGMSAQEFDKWLGF